MVVGRRGIPRFMMMMTVLHAAPICACEKWLGRKERARNYSSRFSGGCECSNESGSLFGKGCDERIFLDQITEAAAAARGDNSRNSHVPQNACCPRAMVLWQEPTLLTACLYCIYSAIRLSPGRGDDVRFCVSCLVSRQGKSLWD